MHCCAHGHSGHSISIILGILVLSGATSFAWDLKARQKAEEEAAYVAVRSLGYLFCCDCCHFRVVRWPWWRTMQNQLHLQLSGSWGRLSLQDTDRMQVETTAAKALRGCECFKSSSHCRDQSKKLKPAKVEAILLDLLGLLDYAWFFRGIPVQLYCQALERDASLFVLDYLDLLNWAQHRSLNQSFSWRETC